MNSSESHQLSKSEFMKFDMSPNSRSFYQRTFSKIEEGSLRAAIFTLMSTALGAGCLTFPLIFENQGIFVGVFLLAFACYISLVGIINITSAAENFKCYEYSELVENVLGNKWKILFDNTVIFYVFGVLIAMQIMIGNITPSLFGSLNINFDPEIERYVVMVGINIFIMIPIGLMKKLTSFRFMSIVSGLTLLYIMLLLIIEFPFFAKHHSYSNIDFFNPSLSTLSGFNICLYGFTCHTNVTQVYDELKRRNLQRMSKVATRSMITLLIPFILLSLFGYLSTMNNTPNLIIMRRSPSGISNDWLMVVSRFLMTITLTIGVPINIPSCRRAIIKSWLKIKDGNPSNLVHCTVTIVLLETTLLIALFYPNILVLFSVLGGFCCGLLVIVFPCKLYIALLKIKAENYDEGSWKAAALKYGSAVLFLIGCTGAVLSVAGIS